VASVPQKTTDRRSARIMIFPKLMFGEIGGYGAALRTWETILKITSADFDARFMLVDVH
jgi:hypothetical protein